MSREENKKKTSDDKVGPMYCCFLEAYCGGMLRAWKKGSYSQERQSVNCPLCSKPSVDHDITLSLKSIKPNITEIKIIAEKILVYISTRARTFSLHHPCDHYSNA